MASEMRCLLPGHPVGKYYVVPEIVRFADGSAALHADVFKDHAVVARDEFIFGVAAEEGSEGLDYLHKTTVVIDPGICAVIEELARERAAYEAAQDAKLPTELRAQGVL